MFFFCLFVFTGMWSDRALADCTFAIIYLDECLLLADIFGTYILVCSPLRWWVMYYSVAFRSVLMIHSSIWEKMYLFLYRENIYFGQIILKNRVLDEWLLLRCRAEVNLSLHSCAVYQRKCLSPLAAIFLQSELAFPVERYSVLCWKGRVFGHVIQFWRTPEQRCFTRRTKTYLSFCQFSWFFPPLAPQWKASPLHL